MNESFARNNQKEPVRGITNISITGYKSLESECNLEVRPLTILAGANSSGKSSVIQPLLLLKQTLEATYDPGALKLDGPNVKFTSASQIFSRIQGKTGGDRFSIQLTIDGGFSLTNTYGKNSDGDIDILETTIKENGMVITITQTMSREEILNSVSSIVDAINPIIKSIKLEKEDFLKGLLLNIERDRCFLNLECTHNSEFKNKIEMEMKHTITLYQSSPEVNLFDNEIRRLIHVPGFRGNPERNYKISGIGSTFPGTFENYTATIINRWQKTEDERLIELWKAMETLGLTSKVVAQKLNDIEIELLVSNLPGKGEENHLVSIADVGFGLSQILPVIVALIVAEPGQLVYLEQPEIHLHPRAREALAEILINAANRGVRLVVETHSEFLLVAFQSLVAEGKLSPEKVKLHWFTKKEDGTTKISNGDLDEAGAYGDWPEDFSELSLDLESRYLDAAEAHLFKS